MITRRQFLKYITAVGSISLIPTLTGCAPECDPNALLEIINRDVWGAVAPDIANSNEGFYDPVFNPGGWYTYSNPLNEALNTIIVHHTAASFNNNPLAVQGAHMNDDGYADIAYQYLVDSEGLIYSGRSINVRGTHTGGHNTGAIGIALFGNFENEEPTTAQLCSLKRLGTWLKVSYDLTHLAGHRDFQPLETVCPGEHLADKLEKIAADLNLEFGTAGYVGAP
jgi:hypothetical protein